MPDAAQRRAEQALTWRKTPDPVDISALSAQLDALMSGRLHG
jgi:beta-N-acetylhexosaminidase